MTRSSPPGTACVLTCILGVSATSSARADEDHWSVAGDLRWLSALHWTRPADTPLNPENRFLSLPQALIAQELRPNLKLEFASKLRLVARPRLRATMQKAYVADAWKDERFDASAEWTELYGTWRASDAVSITYGLQDFEWGPGELMSPSNRLFHVTGLLRDPLFLVRGRHLVRVNASVGRAWSAVVLAEVADNGEPPFVAGESFSPKGLVKLEWTRADGTGYVGLTGGGTAGQRPWFGEYVSWELLEGLSLHADASHAPGSRAWYPRADSAGLERRDLDASSLRTLAIAGARYSFEGGTELRFEYVYDDAGWTRDELRRGATIVRAAMETPTASTRTVVAISQAPGLELLGRQFAYASVRIPDLPPRKEITLQLRYLHSLTDDSGAAFAWASWNASDALVVYLSALATHGPDHGELSRTVRSSIVLTAEHTW